MSTGCAQMGLESYIDQQLHPERIADTSMNARLNGLETLTKSSREIADDYFIPAMRARARGEEERADRQRRLPR